MELQLPILVDVQESEDLLWTEVQLLSQLLLTVLDHQLALHQTLQLGKLHHQPTFLLRQELGDFCRIRETLVVSSGLLGSRMINLI